jgi:hypothetical protein
MGRGRVAHFEIAKPSLHDIFVRIARPEPHESVGATGDVEGEREGAYA